MQIERSRGDTTPDSFTITNAKTRALVNLTGCSFKLTLSSVQSPVDITTQIYQLVGDIPAPTTGVVQFSPSEAQADLVGLYYFDVQMIDSFNKIITLATGTYLYKQDITK